MQQIFPIQGYNSLSTTYHDEPCYYIYQYKKHDHTACGLICGLSLDLHAQGKLLLHEEIFSWHVEDLLSQFLNEQIQRTPIMAIHQCGTLHRKIQAIKEKAEPLFFPSVLKDEEHTLFKVTNQSDIEILHELSSQMEQVCVADGHHRFTALTSYYKHFHPAPSQPLLLTALFYHTEVMTIRQTATLNYPFYCHDTILDLLSNRCDIQSTPKPMTPLRKGEFSMYLQDRWYSLQLKSPLDEDGEISSCVSTEVFKEILLKKIFRIEQKNLPHSVKFKAHLRDFFSLHSDFDHNQQIGFILYPDVPKNILDAAKKQQILSPNSTYFVPKLPNNMISHRITINPQVLVGGVL